MPDLNAHLRKVGKNIAFLDACESAESVKISQDHCEWSIVVKFYACLHVVEAIGAPKDIHFGSHTERNTKIYHISNLYTKEFAHHYSEMYNLSKKARYMDYTLRKEDLVDFDAAFDFIMLYGKTKHKLALP